MAFDYEIVKAVDPEALELAIIAKVADGYHLVGGPFMWGNWGNRNLIAQAVCKDEPAKQVTILNVPLSVSL